MQELAAAFPDLVTRMNDHIDWTEQAGEAVLAQTDDVLASIQRLRAKAQENGYLVDNAGAERRDGGRTRSSSSLHSPGVVYVPTYQSEVVYTTPITTPPVYYYDDYDGDDWEDAVIAGGIILGGAIILDEIFDDNDWDGWDDWDNDVDLDWDGGDITIDRGDINIDRDEINIGGGDRVTIGDGQLGDGQRGRMSATASLATGAPRRRPRQHRRCGAARDRASRWRGDAARGRHAGVGRHRGQPGCGAVQDRIPPVGGRRGGDAAGKPSFGEPSLERLAAERGNAAFRVEQVAVGGPEFQHLAPDDDTAADRAGAEQLEHLPEIDERKPRLRLEQPRTLEREQKRRRRRKKEIT